VSRGRRIVRNLLIGASALIVIAAVAALLVVRTEWFRNYFRQQIVSAAEESTGGRVAIGSFDLDVSPLEARIGDFVIHGNEPLGSPPFLRVRRIVADLRLLPHFNRLIDISYLGIDGPESNVMVLADGRTNIPTPKHKTESQESTLRTVVDLAVGRFDLNHGAIVFDSRRQALNLRGNNLRAQLSYNLLSGVYAGQISMEPLYVVSGRNTPVSFKITLPVTIGSDRIEVHRANISTPASSVFIDGSFNNVRAPRIAVRIDGTFAIADLKNAGDLPLAVNQTSRGAPSRIALAANITASPGSIEVAGFRMQLGDSSIEASGSLQDPRGRGSLAFRSKIDMGEIGRLAKLSTTPAGALVLNGIARLGTGGRELNFTDLEAAAFGARFSGAASLHDFQKYNLRGELRAFDIAAILRATGGNLPYDGVVSGSVAADGNLKTANALLARVQLSIAPGKRGIPVSGRLNANYRGESDNAVIANSWIALPHSRLDLNGSLDHALSVSLKTSDLNDLMLGNNASLNHGQAIFSGTVTGGLKTPRITGHFAARHFTVESRQFDSLAADVAASSSRVAIANGVLARAPMQASFSGSLGLNAWKPLPREPVAGNVSIADADLADAIALAGQNIAGYSGALNATMNIAGTVGNPVGNANLQVANGAIAGQTFDQARLQATLSDRLVTIPTAYIQAGAGRVELNGEFRHPANSFTTGHLRAALKSNTVDLAKIIAAGQQRSNASGTLRLNVEIAGDLNRSEFMPATLGADVAARALRIGGQAYGDLDATATTTGQTAIYKLTSDFGGSSIVVNGKTQLIRSYPTTADAAIANLPTEKVLAAARRGDIPVRGTLNGSVQLRGDIDKPEAQANFDLVRGAIFDEPIDQMHFQAAYLDRAIDVAQFRVVAGDSRIEMTAHYDHPAGTLLAGNATFTVESSRIDLARIHNVQLQRPGLKGAVQITAHGVGALGQGEPRIQLKNVSLNLAATGIAAEGRNFGDLKLTANSAADGKVDFALDSGLAGASIHGSGTAALTAGYPVDAQVSFNNVLYTRVADLLGTADEAHRFAEAQADGQFSLNGPLLDMDRLRARFQLTRLNITAQPQSGQSKPIAIANQGPMTATLDRGVIQISNAHLSGAQSDIQLAGTASLPAKTLALTINANVGLGILPNFDRDVYSSGQVDLAATVRGSMLRPLVDGQLRIQDAAFNYASFPTGISKANGVVAFNGTNAAIRSLTADAGGGKVTISGFLGYSDQARFSMRVKASQVRARMQEGVSVTANSDLQLSGTSRNSVISGTAVVEQVSYTTRTDFGSMLSRATPTAQSVTPQSSVLDNMRLDIRVRAASGLSVHSDIAQGLSANVDLRVRGTAAQPGILGKITVNEGQLVFFGSNYTINTGTIAFYNPLQFDPILDLSLETQAQGVDVTVRITGPVDNMKLSYTSNPPLQFQEIVGLLAAGRTPTSDPTLLANQPDTPASSLQQMGESAALGEAVANPVAGRLQRVFGVSQLKVDPAFQGGSETPTARLTLQQRITNNLTFTYTSALDDPNGEIVQVRWTFDPKWSAVATRDQNGIFSINFLYKRQFR
jgi:translocation and assembly module TamB